jgi:hypothetical protein
MQIRIPAYTSSKVSIAQKKGNGYMFYERIRFICAMANDKCILKVLDTFA